MANNLSNLYKKWQQINIDILLETLTKEQYTELNKKRQKLEQQIKTNFKKAIDNNEDAKIKDFVETYNKYVYGYEKLNEKNFNTILESIKERFYPRTYIEKTKNNNNLTYKSNPLTRKLTLINNEEKGIITVENHKYKIQIDTSIYKQIPNYTEILLLFNIIASFKDTTFTTNNIAIARYQPSQDKPRTPTANERADINNNIFYGLASNVFIVDKKTNTGTNANFIKLSFKASLEELKNSSNNITFKKMRDLTTLPIANYTEDLETNTKQIAIKNTKKDATSTGKERLKTLLKGILDAIIKDNIKIYTIDANKIYETAKTIDKSREAKRKTINQTIEIIKELEEEYKIKINTEITKGNKNATKGIKIKI